MEESTILQSKETSPKWWFIFDPNTQFYNFLIFNKKEGLAKEAIVFLLLFFVTILS